MTDLVADLIATAAPRTKKVAVCGRGDLVAAHADLVEALAGTANSDSIAGNPDAKRIAEQIVAVEDEMEASTVTFTLSAVGRKTWADLLVKHPAGKQHRGMDHNPDTFPPAALAACATEPQMTVEQAIQLSEVLPAGEWNKLWLALIELNVVATPHPKLAAATEILRASERSLTTPPSEASPGLRSSDGSGDPSPSTSTTTPGA